MIQLVFFFHRKAELSYEEFHDYWRNHHAPLIRRHAQAFGICKYIQVHALDDPRNVADERYPDRYDGIAQLWFKSREHLELWFHNSTPETMQAGKEIRADERKFVERSTANFLIGEEITIIEGDHG